MFLNFCNSYTNANKEKSRLIFQKNAKVRTFIGAENKTNTLPIVKIPLTMGTLKEIIDTAIRTECKRKRITAPHYKHTKYFFSGPNKNMAKKILNL